MSKEFSWFIGVALCLILYTMMLKLQIESLQRHVQVLEKIVAGEERGRER